MSSEQPFAIQTTPNPDDAPRLLLKVEEAAQRLGIGRSTMYALVLAGDVESVLLGRLRRIPADALPRYVELLRQAQAGDHKASA